MRHPLFDIFEEAGLDTFARHFYNEQTAKARCLAVFGTVNTILPIIIRAVGMEGSRFHTEDCAAAVGQMETGTYGRSPIVYFPSVPYDQK
jgi:hypothetical protein